MRQWSERQGRKMLVACLAWTMLNAAVGPERTTMHNTHGYLLSWTALLSGYLQDTSQASWDCAATDSGQFSCASSGDAPSLLLRVTGHRQKLTPLFCLDRRTVDQRAADRTPMTIIVCNETWARTRGQRITCERPRPGHTILC